MIVKRVPRDQVSVINAALSGYGSAITSVNGTVLQKSVAPFMVRAQEAVKEKARLLSNALGSSGAPATEDEAMRAIANDAVAEFGRDETQKNFSVGKTQPAIKPPESYTCMFCGKAGDHFLQGCGHEAAMKAKEEGWLQKVKLMVGAPSTSVTYVSDPRTPGAFQLQNGAFAIHREMPDAFIKAQEEAERKKKAIAAVAQAGLETGPEVPVELRCMVCWGLLVDPVAVPCCSKSFCNRCIRDALVQDGLFRCPHCKHSPVRPAELKPDPAVVAAVAAYEAQQAAKEREEEERQAKARAEAEAEAERAREAAKPAAPARPTLLTNAELDAMRRSNWAAAAAAPRARSVSNAAVAGPAAGAAGAGAAPSELSEKELMQQLHQRQLEKHAKLLGRGVPPRDDRRWEDDRRRDGGGGARGGSDGRRSDRREPERRSDHRDSHHHRGSRRSNSRSRSRSPSDRHRHRHRRHRSRSRSKSSEDRDRKRRR